MLDSYLWLFEVFVCVMGSFSIARPPPLRVLCSTAYSPERERRGRQAHTESGPCKVSTMYGADESRGSRSVNNNAHGTANPVSEICGCARVCLHFVRAAVGVFVLYDVKFICKSGRGDVEREIYMRSGISTSPEVIDVCFLGFGPRVAEGLTFVFFLDGGVRGSFVVVLASPPFLVKITRSLRLLRSEAHPPGTRIIAYYVLLCFSYTFSPSTSSRSHFSTWFVAKNTAGQKD